MKNENLAPRLLTEPKTNESKSLHELLFALNTADEALGRVDLNEQIDLLDHGRVKVDNYRYILDKLETQQAYLAKRREEYAKAERVIKNNIKRIKDHLVWALQTNGFSKFTGNEWTVAVTKNRPSVEIKSEATAALKIKYPDLIETKYEWKKTEVAKVLKTNPQTFSELAQLNDSFYPRFSIKSAEV